MVIILIPPPHQIDFVSLRTRSPFRYFLTMLPFSLTILNVLSKIWLFCLYPSSPKNGILDFFFEQKKFSDMFSISHLILLSFSFILRGICWMVFQHIWLILVLNTTIKTLHSKLYEHCTSILKDLMGRTVLLLVAALTSGKIAMRSSSSNPNCVYRCSLTQQCSKRSASYRAMMIWVWTSKLMCYWRRYCGAISEI